MKANEFVKKFGITRAHQILKYSNHKHKRFLADRISVTYNEMDIHDWTSIDDLKRLVESHELVENYGGLDKAKLRCYPAKHLTMQSYHTLRDAVADVESCQ